MNYSRESEIEKAIEGVLQDAAIAKRLAAQALPAIGLQNAPQVLHAPFFVSSQGMPYLANVFRQMFQQMPPLLFLPGSLHGLPPRLSPVGRRGLPGWSFGRFYGAGR